MWTITLQCFINQPSWVTRTCPCMNYIVIPLWFPLEDWAIFYYILFYSILYVTMHGNCDTLGLLMKIYFLFWDTPGLSMIFLYYPRMSKMWPVSVQQKCLGFSCTSHMSSHSSMWTLSFYEQRKKNSQIKLL